MQQIKTYETVDFKCGQLLTNHKIDRVDDDYIIVKNDEGLYGLISLHSKRISDRGCILKYEKISEFREGIAIAKEKGNIYNLIDKEGNELLELEAYYVEYFQDDMYRCLPFGKSVNCLVNSTGQIIAQNFDSIEHFEGEYTVLHGYWRQKGIINRSGQEVIKPIYYDVEIVEDNYAILNRHKFVSLKQPNIIIVEVELEYGSTIHYLGTDRLCIKEEMSGINKIIDFSGNIIKETKKTYSNPPEMMLSKFREEVDMD